MQEQEESNSKHSTVRSRKFFRVDNAQEQEHQNYQQQERVQAELQDPGKEKLLELIRGSIIGDDELFKSPFGYRKITYCDYVASGRSLSFIEDYIRKEVLTLYGNTHTTTSITGHQSTLFRHEARQIILSAANAAKDDRLIFTGSGSTAAVNKLVHMLNLVNEELVPIVFVGPYEHHSNLLPWREANAQVITIDEDQYGQIDVARLETELQACTAKFASSKTRPMIIGAFSAASNVTGIKSDTNRITDLLHRYDALAVWDYACAAPYTRIDMNPVAEGYERNRIRKDAIFISPHKFIGGVETPGVLIVKKHLFKNKVPEISGGGTVFFVTEKDHRYLKKAYEREEGGTPSIVGSIRAGLVFQLRASVGEETIEQREASLCKRAMEELRKNENLVILGNTDVPRLAIFSFLVRFNKMFLHYNYVSILLNDLFGIQVRGGCACAGPYAQSLLGIDYDTAKIFETVLLEDDDFEFIRPGFTRFSFNYFVDDETFQYVIDAINFVANEGWKLLPLYTFYPETGEWVHVNNKKFATRRWLHAITYKEGKMEWRKAVNMKVSTKEYKKYMEEARATVNTYYTEFEKKSYHLPETQFLLPDHAEKLRWFAYSNEALNVIRNIPTITNSNCLIKPRQYTAKYELEREPLSLSCDTFSPSDLPQAKECVPAAEDLFFSTANTEEMNMFSDLPIEHIETPRVNLWPKIDKKLYSLTKKAICEFKMIQEGDNVMLGLSGGKDSLTMLHVLHLLQRKLPFKFTIAACTVDPQTDTYDPSPLKQYMKQLGVPYFFESQGIIEDAKDSQPVSICSWCSRMKRGILYNTCRREGCNVLVLAQHLDDLAESFMMSLLHNGFLRTQKVNYLNDAGDVRVIRPFVYVRERDIKQWARESGVPIINENCPACFEIPKERARIKSLLSSQEHLYPDMFHSILAAMRPMLLKDLDNGTMRKFKTAFHNIKKPKDSLSSSSSPLLIRKPAAEQKNEQEAPPQEQSNTEMQTKQEPVPQNIAALLRTIDTKVLEQELARRKQ